MKYQFDVVNDKKGRTHRVDYRVEAAKEVMRSASRVVPLRPDLILSISAVRPGIEATFKFEVDKAPIHFGFVISGSNRCTYHEGQFKNKTHLQQKGNNGIYYFPETSGIIETNGKNGTFILSILTTPSFLDQYFNGDVRIQSHAFKNIFNENRESYFWRGTVCPAKTALVSQILDNNYSGAVSKLFLESRVLELIARQLDECLDITAADHRACYRLRNKDVDCIKAARDILIKDFENPPSLRALAKMAGINEKKLKAGFKQVFGQSVFAYFRNHRLERAREMLVSGGVTVSEAAYQIGYQSLSYFSRAFRERYGLNPKDYGHLRPDRTPCGGQGRP